MDCIGRAAASSITSEGADADSMAKKNCGPRPAQAVPAFRSFASKLALMAPLKPELCECARAINSGAVSLSAAHAFKARLNTAARSHSFLMRAMVHGEGLRARLLIHAGHHLRK